MSIADGAVLSSESEPVATGMTEDEADWIDIHSLSHDRKAQLWRHLNAHYPSLTALRVGRLSLEYGCMYSYLVRKFISKSLNKLVP